MPTLHQVLMDLLLFGASAAIAYLAPKVKAFVLAHTTANQRTVLEGMAAAVVPFVERMFPQLAGADKMSKAVEIVDHWLTQKGIPLSAQDIESAIEKAWAEAKTSGLLSPYVKPAAAPKATAKKKSPAKKPAAASK